ncbi:hypothetical protein ACF0H5_004403 [Mactra antiquata]
MAENLLIQFEKLPKLPKGSDVFELVLLEIEKENDPVSEPNSDVDDTISVTSSCKSSTRSIDSPRRINMWTSSRARMGKSSVYKTVMMALQRRRYGKR